MATIDLIGVAFDGYARPGHQARAAEALRDAGLPNALEQAGGEVIPNADITGGPDDPERAPGSGLINEAALLAMVEAVHARVGEALAKGRFPLVYGADCTVLLGAVPALRDAVGTAGLLHVDGHEDATPLASSPDGEAANMEIGLLLGITRDRVPAPLLDRMPALRIESLAMLGPRDDVWRREIGVPSLAERGVLLHPADDVAGDPARRAREAVVHLRASAAGWWLHVDLDVLSTDDLHSQLVPGDGGTPGGMSWSQLTELVTTALEAGGCRGMSVTIYDPEQDPDGSEARRIVHFLADIAPHLPQIALP